MKNDKKATVKIKSIVVCGECDKEIYLCALCQDYLIENDDILCTENGHYHQGCNTEIERGHSKSDLCAKAEVFTADQLLTVEEMNKIKEKLMRGLSYCSSYNAVKNKLSEFIELLNEAQQKKVKE